MSGLFGTLSLARRALMSQQLGMNVTSHNIANAATPGYTRQRADLAATLPFRNAQGLFIGTGVEVDGINRLRDRFLDNSYRQSSGSLGSASLRYGVLNQIEVDFQEPGDNGLQAAMDKFFNAFQELSAHPEESGPRNNVLTQATTLVQRFNRLNTTLTTQRNNLIEAAASKVASINALTEKIAALNQQIGVSRGGGNEPNDLLDQRDLAIDQLSKLANITASLDSTGTMLVSIGGTLVASNGSSVPLKSSLVGTTLKITSGTGQDVQVTGGEVGALLEMHNTTIPGYTAQLDSLASSIITRVNALHSAGYGLGTPPPTGMDFFTGSSASTIAVNSQISSNTDNIAASSTGAPGDNRNALALYGIMNERLMDGGTKTVTQFYSRFVSSIGSDITSAGNSVKGVELVLGQLESQRDSVSGVSLDEEMTNLIKFQRSYEAAARIINTADEMLQTVLNMV